MSVKRITIVLLILTMLSAFAFTGFKDAVKTSDLKEFRSVELKSRHTEIKELNVQYDKLNQDLENAEKQKQLDQAEVEQLRQRVKEQDAEKQRLKEELQSKAEQKSKLAQASEKAVNVLTGTKSASAAALDGSMSGCGDNKYAAYIYGMESGGRVPGNCNLTDTNSLGCVGIGQSCPGGSGLTTECPNWRTDYACQNAHFTKYAIERYGSWEGAYNFWVNHKWW